MLKLFSPLTKIDTSEMLAYVESMEEVVEAIDEGLIPNASDYTIGDLERYVRSLIEAQRKKATFVKPGCWCVVTGDEPMPSDARVDFVFRPTYAAVATLSRTLVDHPIVALRIPGYLAALKRGMRFATYRGLGGHGFDADLGAIHALRILSMGNVPWLLDRHPDLCPSLHRIIRQVANTMQHRLSSGQASGPWGEDLSTGFRQAIETLRLVNDRAFMESIAEAKQDPSLIPRKDWTW